MTTVGVVFGGPSAEHNVSCSSALAVVRALPRDRFEPVAIGIESDGTFRRVPADVIESLRVPEPGVRAIDDRLPVTGPSIGPGAFREVDVVLPLLHGPFGEDGVFQGFLETLGIPYAGCGVMASAIGMNKIAMKRAFRAENIPVTPYVHLTAHGRGTDALDKLERPVFVKPASMGSSIGISRVMSDDDLAPAIEKALRYDDEVIIEQGVSGREIECGVLGGYEPTASVVGEVTVTGGWFDYRQKYFAAEDPMIVPADLPRHVEAEVRELSVRAFQAVGCWGLARVDFLYEEATGALFVNELNTMPGFTAHSMYPKVWAQSGIAYPDLVTRLIDLAFERHAARRRRMGEA